MAINFAGGTDRVRHGAGNSATGCVAFWMKTTQTTVSACLLSNWSLASRLGYGLYLNNPLNKITVQGYASTSPAKVNIDSTTSINDGNWHHIAFNWNVASGGANTLYVDGGSGVSANSTAAWSVAGTGFYLGDNIDTFWPSYVGDMAELAEWSRQLDASEVAALAKGFSPIIIAPASLVHYDRMIRDVIDLKDSFSVVTGTTVSDHPRMIGR
jgi:hypothetical protein